MTVGICIKCSDGIVLACDSLTTFGRGVPVLKHSNKVHVLRHEFLEFPVAIEAAGMTTFFDKFRDRVLRNSIASAYGALGRKLDIVDFCESVCEPTVLSMFKEYVFDRAKFLQSPPMSESFSLSLIVAGATRDKGLRAYVVYDDGLTEEIDSYGTIGSGAAYAELFLRFLVKEPEIKSADARGLAVYAVKGVELMDPNVGGPVNTLTIAIADEGLACTPLKSEDGSKAKMEQVLLTMSSDIQSLVEEEKPTMREPAKGEVVEVISNEGRRPRKPEPAPVE